MNCQEFRAIGLQDADENALSHLETCDSCLDWIESVLTGHEEVQFMKEFPQPSEQLEDKIMQSIYSSIELAGVPPLTATQQRPAIKRWRFSPVAWTGAVAGLFLTIGLIGSQLGNNPQQELISHSATSSGGAESAAQSDAQSSTGDEPALHKMMLPEQEEGEIAYQDNASLALPAEASFGAAQPTPKEKDSNQSAANPPASNNQNKQAPTGGKSIPSGERTIPSNQQPVPSVGQSAPPLETAVAIDTLDPRHRPQTTSRGQNGLANGSTAAEQAENKETANNQVEQLDDSQLNGIGSLGLEAHDMSDGEQSQEQPITLSTFTDIKSAASISNLSVPYLDKTPDGFNLQSVSLRFQSETSNDVIAVNTEYTRNKDTLSLKAIRNDGNQRSLSIPGTFVDRRIFTVGEDQAIAVTHDPQVSDSTSEHEIHLITTHDEVPLYVVMKATGIDLDAFIDTAKNLNWKNADNGETGKAIPDKQ